ncbi:hypothetical protein ACN2XU_02680 [Primorskyibacter sp. 2E107]|uniref:hypothetical protein n=1 Tax=Primorskyibacter sp. 2E107 TaxID=3403458 RepID=UPI003AF8454C
MTEVWYGTPLGTVFTVLPPQMRLDAEVARCAAIKAGGAVPVECGDAYADAPARGCFRVVETKAMYPVGSDGYVARPAGYLGRKTIVVQDVFGVMLAQAARAKRAAPLTASQVAMGRFYRDLHERHVSAGLRCTSLEAMPGGQGGTHAGFMDAVLADRQRLDVLRRRLSDGPAPRLRVLRPSRRGARVSISERVLVDMVCLGQRSLDSVLEAHGWAVKGETRKAARAALADGLAALLGPMRGARLTAAHFGEGPASIWSDQKGA